MKKARGIKIRKAMEEQQLPCEKLTGKIGPPRHLTLIYPYYEAPTMLATQLLGWSIMPEEMRGRFTVILVDDGSPKNPALETIRHMYPHGERIPFDLQLYRIGVDIPWNQHGARNLGAQAARDGWLFLSDIDHTLPAGSLLYLLGTQLNEGQFYTFRRMTAFRNEDNSVGYEPMIDNRNGKPKPHPNTFLVTKRMYWEAGGYDEDYCGTYGGDGPFRRWLDRVGEHVHLDLPYVMRWPREVIADASQPVEFREAYRGKYDPVFRGKGGGASERPKTWVRFPWEKVELG